MSNEPLGCFIDPSRTAVTVERMEAAGIAAQFGYAQPSLAGFAKKQQSRGVIGVFAEDAEREITGTTRPAYRQTRGVCVSRGTGGAILDAYYYALATGGHVGRVADIATEPIYAGARITISGGSLGFQDGAFGCDAAEYVARYGVVERKRYNSIDLTRPDDEVACAMGAPGHGVPGDVQSDGSYHLIAAHRVTTVEQLADAIWAGYFAAECRGRWCSSVDSEGFGIFANSGGHCTEICGAYLDHRGRLCFVAQQSHGSGRPTANPVANMISGPKRLRDGCYPLRAEQMPEAVERGECWVFGWPRGHEFRGDRP